MFNKNIIVGTIAVFITTMVFGFLVFGMALENFYMENIGDVVVRPQGEELMEWLAIAQLIMAYAFVWIWSQAVNGSGMMEGVRYGLFVGLFLGATEMIFYAFMPMAKNVMFVNFAGDVVMMIVAGIVLSLVWSMLSKSTDNS